jgi:aspartate aminotransferase-like enzyme
MQQNSPKKLLLTAGPAPISPAIQIALSQPMVYHRSSEFIQIFERVIEGFKYLFQTEYEVFILTASGTGGMEATITNLFSPGESVLVIENGKFSERWSQIVESYRLNVKRLVIPWGKSVAVEDIRDAIQNNPSIKAVFLTHCETSTGAITDLKIICRQIRDLTSALIIVDAISSAGVLPLKMDQWGIDVIVTASQKGLGLPPGLSIVALNKQVWRVIEQAELPRYYFDFARARQALRLGRGSAFTPSIPLILAADISLNELRQIGLEKIWQARKAVAADFREKIIAAGLTIFPENPADSLTVIKIEAQEGANQVISLLKDKHGIVVSKGQGRLANKVIRAGHFVNVETRQLDQFLEALKTILTNLNLEVKNG